MTTFPQPRNVIWITTDHLRYDFLGASGSPWMHTPHLDRLAAGGIRFSHCYANAPVCMPSRCSFMTGCYPVQTGVMTNGQELRADFPSTVARCFSGGGYRTTQIGKLHFQNHQDYDLDPRAREAYGFDNFLLSEEPGCYEDAYRVWLRGEHPEWVETFTVRRPASFERKAEKGGNQVLDAPWELSHSGWIARQTERYLQSWGRPPGPQFLHLGFYAPHPPLNPTREMMAPYEGVEIPPPISASATRLDRTFHPAELADYRRHFAGMVTGIDFAVGELLRVIESMGEWEETLVIFSSDHGDLCGDHGGVGKGSSWYEGIMRLPLLMHWPQGFGREGRVAEGLFEMVDLLPTLLGLCQLRAPVPMAGSDWSGDLLRGGNFAGRPDVLAMATGSLMLRTRDSKYLREVKGGNVQEVLYDLAADPEEYRDLSADPEWATKLGELRDRAFTRFQGASEPLAPRRFWF